MTSKKTPPTKTPDRLSKKQKRLFLLSIFVTAALLTVGILCWIRHDGSQIVASGNCGNGISWNLNRFGTLTISGNGATDDYSENADLETPSSDAPWQNKCKQIKKAIIKEGIVGIGNFLFAGCDSMTQIELPNSLTDMGIYCFAGCKSLKTISLPEKLQKVGDFAFYNCQKLRTVQIDNGISELGMGAFQGCSALKSIDLPDSIKVLNTYCFFRCSNLKEIRLPENITQIPEGCFAECIRLQRINLPVSVVKIQDRAFNGCTSLLQIDYSGTPEEYNAIEIGKLNEGLNRS